MILKLKIYYLVYWKRRKN